MKSDGPDLAALEAEILAAVAAARGHICYESGHHGDLWLDLDRLLVDARGLYRWSRGLARQATGCRPQVVCGPQPGGAELGTGFVYSERIVVAGEPARYHLPPPLREAVRGRRLLLVDDAVNAGSALARTLDDLAGSGGGLWFGREGWSFD